MTDYYKQFIAEAGKLAGELAKERDDLVEQIAEARKKVVIEQAAAERVQRQIDKLNDLAGQSLSSGQNSYEGYKTSLRKRKVELQTLMEIVENLSDNVIPGLEKRRGMAGRKLVDYLRAYTQEKTIDCRGAITAAFEKYILEDLHDNFTDSMAKFWADYAERYPTGLADCRPGLTHPRLTPDLLGLIADRPAKK